MKRITRALIPALVLLLLQGCLLTRLHQTQKQICSKKTRLEMTQDGLAIVFDQPLLTRDDIVTILEAKTGGAGPDNAALVYIARNKNDEAYNFPVSFQFSSSGKQNNLTKVSIGKRFQDLLSEELLRKVFDAGCSAQREGFRIEVDISRVPIDALPTVETVKKLLGRPALMQGDAAIYTYEFGLNQTAEIAVSYNADMSTMTNAGLSFQKYEIVFDFKKGVATAALKSFSEAVRLGFKP